MKTFTAILLTMFAASLFAQTFTDKITKEFKFEKSGPQNTLMLANINGNIKVEGYAGDKILIEAVRIITAKTDQRLEQGKKEMQLRQIDLLDTVIYYVGGECNKFAYQKNKKGKGHWGYNWNCDDDCESKYNYKFNFIIKVPQSLNVDVSTVNDGNVSISLVKGVVKAGNVNGAIALTDLEGRAEANTINGDVDFTFVKNPTGYCRFYTLNGDINAYFQKGLAANMSFKSFNGDLYTNLEKLESLPMAVEKVNGDNGYRLKVGGSKYKVGAGGPTLEFETFNGDAIVKER